MQKQEENNEQSKTILEKQYILMTYRSKIQKAVDTTYYNSDTGWGCMLRVGQMLIANMIYIKQGGSVVDIIRLFYDNMLLPFSIQTITNLARQIYPEKKEYEWYSPCQCGFIVKNLIEKYDSFYRVSICNDNTMFLSEIQRDRKKIMVIVMCRIGLDEPEQAYLNCVIRLMSNPFFFGIMGGTPRKAHLFMKHHDGKFGYLDPHTTYQTVPNIYQMVDNITQYTSKLQWIKQKSIDTSMAICFHMMQSEVDKFWQDIQALKKQLGPGFFIYIERQRPQFDQQGIIQIQDEDF